MLIHACFACCDNRMMSYSYLVSDESAGALPLEEGNEWVFINLTFDQRVTILFSNKGET